jgi:hypothetical protein
MAVSSLQRMTVPIAAAGDQSNGSQGLLMPKLKYRFRVFFENFGTTSPTSELTKQVINITRPNLTFEEIALPIYNSTLKLAGKPTWADITCSIRDDATASVSKLVGQQLQKQMDFLEMASAAAGIDYKFKTVIEVLDGGNGTAAPVVLEAWELYGCYLKGANYGDMNYGSNEAVTIELSIAYDNAAQSQAAALQTSGVGIGLNIGRALGSVVTGVASSNSV